MWHFRCLHGAGHSKNVSKPGLNMKPTCSTRYAVNQSTDHMLALGLRQHILTVSITSMVLMQPMPDCDTPNPMFALRSLPGEHAEGW